ncbi:hypothetical protein J7I84_07000 [Arthrobacter sp. ISL-85]|uniref:hypothetical protein n=1 Tax=Arthrobacter sp. ISL-85 TaxID=2819115 RepID=UPI001BEB2B82|nr:hypothetical protein [Arthrobacter sp. ISL-85]MBT2566248.1 hypothetical protein [Arthrobacter sp. ISL-85]
MDVWKDDEGELSIHISTACPKVARLIDLGREPSITPGPEHAWIRALVCEALYSAMGRYGLDAYTKIIISKSRGRFDVCEMAHTELGAGRVLE